MEIKRNTKQGLGLCPGGDEVGACDVVQALGSLSDC